MDAKTLNRTINAVCARLANFFVIPAQTTEGKHTLTNGQITLLQDFKVGQRIYIEPPREEWIRAPGSWAIKSKLEVSDGFLYDLDGAEDISDEWAGVIYGQRIPPALVSLAEKIAAWTESPKNAPTAVVSHGVGGYYTETRATGADGLPVGWEAVFAKDLAQFPRQMVTGVRY